MNIRKHIFLLIALILGGIGAAVAQTSVGSWKIYSTFASIDKVLDTSSTVYYLTCGQLYAYDKEGDETYNYSSGGRLSDSNIHNIFYNHERDFLVVAYDNANIDVIDSDGRVYGMPDIMDASLDVVPTVNDVDFSGNKIYVATNFGVVVFDAAKKEVITAGNYGKNITSVMVSGDRLWLVEGFRYYDVDKDAKLTSINNLVQSWGLTTHSILSFGNQLAAIIEDGLIITDFSNPADVKVKEIISDVTARNLTRTRDGGVMCHGNTIIYTVSPDGTVTRTPVTGTNLETIKVGNVYETKQIAGWKGLEGLWMGSDTGIANYSLKDGEFKVLSEAYRPDNVLTFNSVGYIYKAPTTGNIYAANYGYSNHFKEKIGANDTRLRFNVNKVNGDGSVEDITPLEYTVKRHPSHNAAPVGFKGGYQVIEDVHNPDYYIVGSMWDGFYVFDDRAMIVNYNEDNSTMKPIFGNYNIKAGGIDFDRKGNLWVAQEVADTDADNIHMLTSDKVGKTTTESDWQVVRKANRESNHDGRLLACKQSDCVMYIDAVYKSPITVIMTKGTDTVDDDEVYHCSMIQDQNGLAFTYEYPFSMIEDQKGRVWIGTDNGIIEVANPGSINGTTLNVNHLKVPRRDGTNYADYLMDGETVIDMAVDPANRKWIATERSGVYLVSENGDEILEHFDMTNSPLPSNSVFAVACGNDNKVYFGTNYGMLMYNGNAAPAADDYSNVYAYPNPVRPEYTGWITITGLMDNSLVKIADAAGNVFYQGTGEGGMITWDGCDRQGRRVKTGVYYVFASQGGDGSASSGAVTKILVVN